MFWKAIVRSSSHHFGGSGGERMMTTMMKRCCLEGRSSSLSSLWRAGGLGQAILPQQLPKPPPAAAAVVWRGYHSKNAESSNEEKNSTNNKNSKTNGGNSSSSNPSSSPRHARFSTTDTPYQQPTSSSSSRQQPPEPPTLFWIPSHLQEQLQSHHRPNRLGRLSIRHPSTPFVLGFSDSSLEYNDEAADATTTEPYPEHASTAATAADRQSQPEEDKANVNPPNQEDTSETTNVQQASSSWNHEQAKKRISVLGRNTRRVNKANHGKRPCNRLGRRWRRSRYGSRKRQ